MTLIQLSPESPEIAAARDEAFQYGEAEGVYKLTKAIIGGLQDLTKELEEAVRDYEEMK